MNDKLAIGIDFGTCFSYAYVCNGYGLLEALINPINNDNLGMPSIFYCGSGHDEKYLVGSAAKRRIRQPHIKASYSKYVVERIKMRMKEAPFYLKSGKINAGTIITNLVAGLFEVIQKEFQRMRYSPKNSVDIAFVGIPVRYPKEYKDIIERATIQAAKSTNIASPYFQVEFIEEPIAIALDYCETEDFVRQPVLVYDLGEGTFDTACIFANRDKAKRTYGDYCVLAKEGSGTDDENKVGAFDWDKALAKLITDKAQELGRVVNISDLINDGVVKETKHELCSEDCPDPYTVLGVYDINKNLCDNITVSVEEFETVTKKWLDMTLALVKDAVTSTGLHLGIPWRVVLSGGGSNMPQVEQGVRKLFNEMGAKIYNDEVTMYRPQEAVARGAARASYWKKVKRITAFDYGVAVRKDNTIVNRHYLVNHGTELPLRSISCDLKTVHAGYVEIVVLSKNKHEEEIGKLKINFDNPKPIGTTVRVDIEVMARSMLIVHVCVLGQDINSSIWEEIEIPIQPLTQERDKMESVIKWNFLTHKDLGG